ncbi:MAG TPA: protein kinase [Thermoanaerobaculia bacterium]|nr:protein kinase [Thermoanaerobaculia bacterium]
MREWEPGAGVLSARVGPYKLEEPLGEGGMGAVWCAWDDRLARQVALKRLRPGLDSPLLRERLLREARAIARLKHPGIIHVYDVVEEGGDAWIVMELVEGVTLRRWIEANGPLSPSQALRLGREIAEGLAEAHAQGILHRDLKATNVMVTPAGHAKILDFGISKQLPGDGRAEDQEETLSPPGKLLGTVYAMSPEQVEGRVLDARSDLFSFGTLLYESMTGTPPFLGEDSRSSLERVLSFQPPPLASVCAGVSPELSDLVAGLLEKDRRLRPGSAREVADALAALSQERVDRPAAGETLSSTVVEAPRSLRPGQAPASLAGRERRRTFGEHRPVTLVCCGLAGADLEALAEAMDDFQRLSQEVCGQFGGQLGGVLGHLVWFSFGYPYAQEDDSQRAVQAARELCSRFSGTALGAGQYLALRIAVHTGPALAALRGGRPERLQPGSTLDLALALQSVAPAGEVVVSAACRLLTGRSFAMEALAPVPVPGSPEPLTLYRVLAAVNPREREEGRLVPLLGRERELALLCDRFRLARSGTGQAVMVSGEPGIGKSRLVEALRERLASEQAVWCFAYGSLTTGSAPLAPILDLLERAVFGPEASGGERNLHQLEDFLSLHGLPLAENVPLLAALLSLPLEGRYAPLALSPGVQRKKTFESLVVLFAEMAERSPLVLVVEDLHWVDPSTLDFLTRLIEEIVALPLLLVTTFRPELQPPWGHRAVLTQLHLSRLTDEETALLVDRLTCGSKLAKGVRQQILRRAEGVPLFAEELARTFLDASRRGKVGEIPLTLGGSLVARLDRAGAAKEVAQVASVIGRTFSYELLESVLPVGSDVLEEVLDQLIRAELVHRRGLGAKARYTFRHALIQEAAYTSLLSKDRHELHMEIARALERQLAGARQADVEGRAAGVLDLAHHWSRAVDPRAPEPALVRHALPHLLAAGEQASRLGAYREAQAHLSLGLDWVPALPEGAERDEQELTFLVRLTQAMKATHGIVALEVRALQERMRALWSGLESHPDIAQILYEIWVNHMSHCELEESLVVAMEGLDRLQAPCNRIMAARCASHSLFFLARLPESLRYSERVLAAPGWQEKGGFSSQDVTSFLFAAHQSALSLLYLGMEEEALQRYALAMELTSQLQDPFIRANSLVEALKFLRRRHDIPEALRTADLLQCLLVEMDLPQYLIPANHTRNWALMESGRAVDVVDATRADLNSREEFFSRTGISASYVATGLLLVRAGNLEEAEEMLERGKATVCYGGGLCEPELYCAIGELYKERASRDLTPADLNLAEEALRTAFTLADQRLLVQVAQKVIPILASLLRSRGRFQEAMAAEIEMQRLRERAAAQAGRVLQETADSTGP